MPSIPFEESRPLPPYRAVLVVDTKDFTRAPSFSHAEIAREVPALMAETFARAGLYSVWADREELGDTGDGIALGFPPAHLATLIYPFLPALQQVLQERNGRTSRDGAHLRFRVSLTVGPISAGGPDGAGDGNGKIRNDAHRLLDSDPVKAMLSGSDETITLVAAIVSARVFEDAVESGYCALRPGHFLPVVATVAGKTYNETAYLYVPERSGPLLATGLPNTPDPDVAPPPTANTGPPISGSIQNTNSSVGTQGINHGTSIGTQHTTPYPPGSGSQQ